MAKKHLALPPPMDLPMIDSDLLGELGFLDGPIDIEPAKQAIPALLGGAGLSLAYMLGGTYIKVSQKDAQGNEIKVNNEVVKVAWAQKPWQRIVMAVGVGTAGAAALLYKGNAGMVSDARVKAVHGIAGGIGAIVASELYQSMMLKSAIKDAASAAGHEGLRGLDADAYDIRLDGSLPEERELLSDVDVEERRPLLGDVQVDERQPGQFADVGSWIG